MLVLFISLISLNFCTLAAALDLQSSPASSGRRPRQASSSRRRGVRPPPSSRPWSPIDPLAAGKAKGGVPLDPRACSALDPAPAGVHGQLGPPRTPWPCARMRYHRVPHACTTAPPPPWCATTSISSSMDGFRSLLLVVNPARVPEHGELRICGGCAGQLVPSRRSWTSWPCALARKSPVQTTRSARLSALSTCVHQECHGVLRHCGRVSCELSSSGERAAPASD